jgi:beta-barrel assembly-enhancing protease
MYKGTFYDKNIRQKFSINVRFTDYGFEIFSPEFITKVNSSDVYVFDEKDKNTVVVKIGNDFPFSVLEVSDAGFKETLYRKYPQVQVKKNHESKGYMVLLTSVLVGLLVLVIGIIYAMPSIGEFVATFVPKEAEIKIGQNYYDSYKYSFKIDTAKTRAANEIFKALDYSKEYPLEITVVQDDIKNAFALPGGHIVVYDRILKDMKTAEEFAALIAHESSHVNHRHATKALGRTAGRSMVLSWIFGNYDGLIQISQEFLRISYTRELEEDADRSGFELMVKNKVNPKGMIALLENLKQGDELVPKAMKYTSTHPLTEDRINMVATLIKGKNYDFPKNPALEKVWEKLKY